VNAITRAAALGILMLLLHTQAAEVAGQDIAVAAPNLVQVKFVNDRMRLMEVKLPRRAKIPAHSLSSSLLYALQGGTLTMLAANGEKQEINIKKNEAVWLKADAAHTTENTGKTKIHLLIVELHEPVQPPQASLPPPPPGAPGLMIQP